MTDKPHILVVDDDDRLRALLKKYLREQGFLVTVAENTRVARELREWFVFDLMVLDVMMPVETGKEWLAREKVTTPVLMLSALGEAENRIEGFELGVEDYLAKPFEPKELVLRIQAILRRARMPEKRDAAMRFGDYTFDMQSGQLQLGDETVYLTSSESDMLKMLAANAGNPVTREQLATLLPAGSNERSVDVQITRLRKKIEDSEGKPFYLQTVRGAGYVLHVR